MKRLFNRSVRAIRGGRVYVFAGKNPQRTNIVALGDYQGEAILTVNGVRTLRDALTQRLKDLQEGESEKKGGER